MCNFRKSIIMHLFKKKKKKLLWLWPKFKTVSQIYEELCYSYNGKKDCNLELGLKLCHKLINKCVLFNKVWKFILKNSICSKFDSFHNLVVKGNCVLSHFKNNLCDWQKICLFKKKMNIFFFFAGGRVCKKNYI